MLKSLFIKNFTLIEETSINFHAGLNIITGETGSGKSLIFDAISICLGDKTSTDIIRNKDHKAILEATFINLSDELISIIKENDYDFEDTTNNELIIRREINPTGNSRIFINDTPSNLNFVKSISEFLIDFHRQNETISILKSNKQIKLLDSFKNYENISNYRIHYKEYNNLLNKLNELVSKKNELIKLKEFNELKLKEIEEVNPEPNELEKIQNELNFLENSEHIYEVCHNIVQIINYDETSILPKLDDLIKNLDRLEEYNEEFGGFSKELSTLKVSLKEVQNFTNNYKGDIEFNPSKIENLRQRERALKILIKKYGSLDSIIELRDSIKNDLNILDSFELDKIDLQKQIAQKKSELQKIANILHLNREVAANFLSQKIENNLKLLGIEHAQFQIQLGVKTNENSTDFTFLIDNKNVNFGANGMSIPEFLFSANLGKEMQYIENVASGGEISRIMLSIKSSMEENNDKLTFIFDEIDTGISGKVARLMGKELKKLGQYQQIISITHLPQIASLGDANFNVSKFQQDNTTISKITLLDQKSKLIEVAKLIGGENYTENSITAAKELME